jgi:D-alanine-D-alanine ligase
MRVLLTYNDPVLPAAHPEAGSEREVLDAVEAISSQLAEAGLELMRLVVGADLERVRGRLREWRPDVVFNLFEGLGDDPHSECRFAQVLEEVGVAYTGCTAQTLWRAGRKDVAKQLFRQAGLPTPDFHLVDKLPLPYFSMDWPAIVKPTFRDASIGIDRRSVVTDRAQLERQVACVADELGLPVLVEKFVRGREISVAMFDWPELRVLPAVETLFVGDNDDWPICTYDSKWHPESRDYGLTPLAYPAKLSPRIAESLDDVARRAYCSLGCRDFVTIDFRVCPEGTPYLLEVNPNPGLKPSSCLVDLLYLAGISYSEFLMGMVDAAYARRLRED